MIEVLDCSVEKSLSLAECLQECFPELDVYVITDIPGEDHIYARISGTRVPIFDMLVSLARKYVFLWYYTYPDSQRGIDMVEKMKIIALQDMDCDFAVKFPEITVKKEGWPSIVRWGKTEAGKKLEKYIIKKGNIFLENDSKPPEVIWDYRNYEWLKVPGALELILNSAKRMMEEYFSRHPKKSYELGNIACYTLYAGCAFSYVFPQISFGMRDIDVNVFFKENSSICGFRAAFTRECGIEDFGTPAYFGYKTRWLDMMVNRYVSDGDNKKCILDYLEYARRGSDRWATISQRPIIILETEEVVYIPNWLKKFSDYLKKKGEL